MEHEESIVSTTLSSSSEVDILQHQVEVATHTSSPSTDLESSDTSSIIVKLFFKMWTYLMEFILTYPRKTSYKS